MFLVQSLLPIDAKHSDWHTFDLHHNAADAVAMQQKFEYVSAVPTRVRDTNTFLAYKK